MSAIKRACRSALAWGCRSAGSSRLFQDFPYAGNPAPCKWSTVSLCGLCVCVCERERERER
eukprot:9250585-Alexandrium_andersonii.AAC.1